MPRFPHKQRVFSPSPVLSRLIPSFSNTLSPYSEGLLFYGNVILPFVDRFPTDLELYRIMTTKLSEVVKDKEE